MQKIVITSAPPQTNQAHNRFIASLNASLREAVKSDHACEYIDLWPLLSDGGKIRPEMTVDGVHFTGQAYRLWSAQLSKYL